MGGGLTGPVGTWNDLNETNSSFAPGFIIEYESDPFVAILTIDRESERTVTIRWRTRPQTPYRLEWKSDVAVSSWVTMTNVAGDGSLVAVSDRAGENSRFYRVLAGP